MYFCNNIAKGVKRFVFCLLLWIAANAVQGQSFYVLQGKVLDMSGIPVTGATVYLHETMQGCSTDSTGFFEIRRIRAGSYHLHVTYIGFQAYDEDLAFSGAAEVRSVQIVLKESDLELNEVVIESNQLKQSNRESSLQLQLIDEKFLMKNQGTTLMNALTGIPGINSINLGLNVSKPVIRGLSGNRVVVAENGVKQEGQQWGADHGLEIDPFQAERIEIIKGPASLVYGSDAMGGVVHIMQPKLPVPGVHEVAYSFISKSVNNTWGHSFMARGNQRGWVYRIRATLMDYGDYRVPAEQFTYNRYVLPIYNHRLKNTAGRERHFSAQLGVHRNWGFSRLTLSRFDQQTGIFAGAVGIPREYALTPDGDNRNIALPNQHTTHWKAISNSNFRFGRHWLEVDLGFQRNERRENSNPHAHGQGPVQGTLAHGLFLQTYTANARFHWKQKKADAVVGMNHQWQQHRFEGFEFLLPRFNSAQHGLFLIEKWKLSPRFYLNAGARYDYGWLNIEKHLQAIWNNGAISGYSERVPDIQRNFHNWSAGMGFSWSLRESTNVKFNVGKSFRIPTAQELSVNGVHHGSFRHEMGNAGLLPESGFQSDLAIQIQERNWLIQVSPFLNYFTNYIFLRPTAQFSPLPEAGQVYQFEQAGALLAGGEVQTEWHPVKGLHLQAGAEYVYGQNLSSRLALPFIPPFQIKANAEYEVEKPLKHFNNLFIRLGWQGAANQQRTDRNEWNTPGYHVFSLALGGSYRYRHKENVRLSISIQNLLNRTYYNHLSRWRYLNVPEPGRNVNIQLTIPLSFTSRSGA